MYKISAFFIGLCILFSCKEEPKELPYLGKSTVENGIEKHHVIRDWSYMNQDSTMVTNKDLADNVYVADFFFTSCPSICPKVMKEMLRLNEEFKNESRVKLVSFTLDPKRDNPPRLKLYSKNLGINNDKWIFLTGDQDSTLDLANDYFVAAYKDDSLPGGFDHSGKIILVDKKGHVRSFSEGTDPTTTPKLIEDIHKLLSEAK